MTTPHSLLFLSCDIVGSTKFKQQRDLWQITFLSFYRQFPQMLGDITVAQEIHGPFELWKPVGDELIFTVRVSHESEIFAAVRSWLEAMKQYEMVLAKEGLATKGGAFLATFPGPDSESSIPRDPRTETSDKGVVELNDEALATRSADYMYDYFGPSIDTGFRVLSACSQRHFTLSVEVAWAMAQCAVDAGVDESTFPLADMRLLDTREFKGVWDGREYPLFSLDRHHDDSVNRALAKLRNPAVQPLAVVNLCRACGDDPNWPSGLYLPNSSWASFRTVPTDSLENGRSNSMDGAETVPESDPGVESLEADAPLSSTPTTIDSD
ncbi:hypothetical protein [Phycicoccus jejuensis]|uniref:hypothetical protein n=1 Tax=Phycicoccus jejuensis TaxID=367299 RepID=UPI0004C3E77C|nr:hypothetical protein [Phycicoccus jejuensis]